MYQKLLFCVYMTAFSSTTTISKARKLSLKDSLSGQCRAASLCSCSYSSSLPSSSSSLMLLLESLSSFSAIIRLEVCDNSASCGIAEMVSLQELCNVCRILIKKQFRNFLNADASFRDGKVRRIQKTFQKIITQRVFDTNTIHLLDVVFKPFLFSCIRFSMVFFFSSSLADAVSMQVLESACYICRMS